jgi:hypothetical protein
MGRSVAVQQIEKMRPVHPPVARMGGDRLLDRHEHRVTWYLQGRKWPGVQLVDQRVTLGVIGLGGDARAFAHPP